MKSLVVIMICALMIVACGGGRSNIVIKTGGKDVSLQARSTGWDKSVKTFTEAGKMSTATTVAVVITNFEADTTNIGTLRKPLTGADQIKLELGLVGEEGTDQKGTIKPGVYKVDPSGKFNKIDFLSVATFADGKEAKTSFEMMFSGSKASGQVEVKSVTDTTVSGTIDVIEGDNSVRGSFSAAIVKKP